MPLITPDTSQVEKQGPIEPGTYPAKITDVGFENSKSSGNPMIVVKHDVTVGDSVRPRTAYLVITGKGAYGFDQLLRATGFDKVADEYSDANVTTKTPFDTDQLIGQELNVVIESDSYQGQLRDKIRSFLKK
jgi:uncharacterized protein DUF669